MAFMEELQHLKIQLEDIKLATNNFADNNVIGVGGFGKVYKGILSHSNGKNMVALKRLDRKYGQGEIEYLKEIVLLSRYTHENIVSLLGFSNEGDEKVLVYEYASRGSLDRHLSNVALTWRQRLKICLTAARGLSYLHHPNTTHQRVIHCDVKSSNILLDENWHAKLSDFGLSKIGPANEQHTYVITNAIGTPGYCDPLYMETYILTKESDVYSFGVVLFEVLCGRLCFEYTNHLKVFVSMWKERYQEKKLDEIIFQGLKQQMDSRSLRSFSDIAYQCLKRSREERPLMSHVLKELESALEYQEIYEGMEQPKNHEEMINTYQVATLKFSPEGEMDIGPSEGILLSDGTMEEKASRPLHELLEWDVNNHRLVPQGYKHPEIPHFGQWDENDTALRDGYTVIFQKVRDRMKTSTEQETPTTNANPGSKDAGPSEKGKKSIWRKFW